MVIVLVGIAVLAGWRFYIVVSIAEGVRPAAARLDNIISLFIRSNGGRFPRNEDELTEYDNRWKYFTGDLFEVSFGARTEDIRKTDGKLYDESTGEQILLISGPCPRQMREDYERTSRHWYDMMLQHGQKTGD